MRQFVEKQRDKSTALSAEKYNFRRFVENKCDELLSSHRDEMQCVKIEKLLAAKPK
jgi:hypothetical protein